MFLEKEKFVIMMIGLPASGKTTIIKDMKEKIPNVVIVSSDEHIENYAENHDLTYDEAFLVPGVVAAAMESIDKNVSDAIKKGVPVIWDQTNLTAKTRDKKLRKFPNEYAKIAFVLTTPEYNEWKERLNNRPGKTIPENVLKNMMNQYEFPTYDENFDLIIDFEKLGNLFE